MAEKRVNQEGRYLSYLLRLWQESAGDPPLWRASLESPRTGARRGFASLEDLFAFLERETGAGPPELQCLDEEGCHAIPE